MAYEKEENVRVGRTEDQPTETHDENDVELGGEELEERIAPAQAPMLDVL